MGNEQGKISAKHTNGLRCKNSSKAQDPKLVKEEQEEKQEEEKHEEEIQEEKQEEAMEQEECREQQSGEKTEETPKDQTNEGDGAGEAGRVEDSEPRLQDTASPLVKPVPRAAEEFVGLNVGGVVYRTSRSTLVRYPNSLLGVLFIASVPTPRDDQGNYMIDGDGQMFRHVLNYLRQGALCLPKDFQEHQLLRYEAASYQLPELEDLVTGILNQPAPRPRDILSQIPIRVEPTKETSKYVIEVYVSEEDDKPQSWRIFGSLSFLDQIPTLDEYIHHYRKGSQCLEFTTQHPMFPAHIYRRFPKTTLFYDICNIGFKLHTSDCIQIINKNDDNTFWLRYLFTSTT